MLNNSPWSPASRNAARLLGDLVTVAPGQTHREPRVVDATLGLPGTAPPVGLLVRVGDDQRAEAGGDDLGSVTAFGRAMFGQDLELVANHREIAEAVPHVGVTSGQPERLPLAAAADEDRRSAGPDGLRHVDRAVDVVHACRARSTPAA